jgi:hypothetical protein
MKSTKRYENGRERWHIKQSNIGGTHFISAIYESCKNHNETPVYN